MLGAYFVRKRRKKGLFSRVHFVFLVLSLRLKMRLRFVLRIIHDTNHQFVLYGKIDDFFKHDGLAINILSKKNKDKTSKL